MLPLAQPPKHDDRSFDDWMYRLWRRIASQAGLSWSLIDKTGSNLIDIQTRNHNDLQNIQGGVSTDYQHLTTAQHSLIPSGVPTVGQVPVATSGTASAWGTVAGGGGNWPSVKSSTAIGETCDIPVGFQLIIADEFDNNGTITNEGEMYLLGDVGFLSTSQRTILVAYLSALTSTWAISTTGNALTATTATNSGSATTATNLSGGTVAATTISGTTASFSGALIKIGNVTTSGAFGSPAIVATGRLTAQVTAQATVSTFTAGASDGSFEVSANVLITTATTHNFTVTCNYTDEGNTARVATFNFSNLAGTLSTAIINTGGTVPYESIPLHIRCKAGTAITIGTTGTFTTVVYNVEGIIKQMA